MAHKDIRIKFEIEDRRFEAVGFLGEGEPPVNGDTMLARTAGENGGAIGDEDAIFLQEHAKQLELLRKEFCPFYFATNRHEPCMPHEVWFFYYAFNILDILCWDWRPLDSRWGENVLVVRRLP